jgi:hypothetical protein
LLAAAQKAHEELETIRALAKAKTRVLRTARAAVVAAHRRLAKVARSNADITDETLAKIGVRRPAKRAPQVAPTDAPVVSLEKVMAGSVLISLRQPGGRRARPTATICAELSLVNATTAPAAGEADGGAKLFPSRCRSTVRTAGSGPCLRLYARWRTQRGETSPWSLAVEFQPQT